MREEFIYRSPDNYNDILFIELAGKSFCDGSYLITRKKSNFYVLEFVIDGTGTIIRNGEPYTASKGDFYILKRGIKHHYYSSKEDPWVKIWINLSGSLIDHLLEVYPLNQTVYRGSQLLLELFQDLHNVLHSNKNQQDLQQVCAILLHQLISTVYFNNQASQHIAHTDAYRIKNYLDTHILESVSLADLSGIIYKSESQIIRIFKKAYEQTPYAYLLSIKLQYAKTLLAQTNLPIKEIASQLNFADEHYFSNYFKQAEKMPPSLYRSHYL